jgi:hypothetical protein
MSSPALGEGTRDPATYVPIHLGILTSPKAERLARLLKVPQVSVIGAVARLSLIVQHHAPDGRLDGWSLEDIGAAAGAPARKTAAWAEALIATGWIDVTEDGYALHDWGEYGGRGVSDRAKDRERKRLARAKAKASAADTAPETADSSAPGPDLSMDVRGPVRVVRPEVEGEVEEEAEEREVAPSVPTTPVTAQGTRPLSEGSSSGASRPHPRTSADRGSPPRAPSRMGRGAIGLQEQATKPKDLGELQQLVSKTLAASKDDRVAIYRADQGRLELELADLWTAWSDRYDERGPSAALHRLVSILAERAERNARSRPAQADSGQWMPVSQRAGAKPAEPPPPKLTEQELLEIDEELLAKAEAEGNESHARAHRRAIKARRDRMAAAAQQAAP